MVSLGLLIACGIESPESQDGQTQNGPASPGASIPSPPVGSVPGFKRIFVVILENHEATAVTAEAMPFLSGLASTSALAERYYAVSHPSLPNYLALLGGDTFGISVTCDDCFHQTPNLADQIDAAGLSWKAYFDGMPNACYKQPVSNRYAMKHNPFMYFLSIRNDPNRCKNVVPLADLFPDLLAARLPNLVWITPDLCHSGHDCDLPVADQWLKQTTGPILESPSFQENEALFITWDEGMSNEGGGGRVFTLVVSSSAKSGHRSQAHYTHYSLLRTIEDAWNLPLLGNANGALPMTDLFKSN